MPKLLSSKMIEKILFKNDFYFISQKGSHKKYKKNNIVVIVPANKKEIPQGTLYSIIRQAKLSKSDFEL